MGVKGIKVYKSELILRRQLIWILGLRIEGENFWFGFWLSFLFFGECSGSLIIKEGFYLLARSFRGLHWSSFVPSMKIVGSESLDWIFIHFMVC